MSRDRLEDFGLMAERIKHLLQSEIWHEVQHPDENVWFEKYHHDAHNKDFNPEASSHYFQNLDHLLTELNWIYNRLQNLYTLARFAEDVEDKI